jgi:predicted O-methyltransferase YrrM
MSTSKRTLCNYGYLPRYCGAWLEGLATTLPDPARTLEIGTGGGCSLIAVVIGLSHHRDAKSWTVDIEPRPHLTHEMEMRHLDPARWEYIHGASLDVAATWGIELDLIYIDGDHSTEGAKADIEAWEPHLKFGGLMVFDDYEQSMWGTTEAVDEIMFALDSTWRYVGQVGRLIAFEKGTLSKHAPWLTEYMIQYDSLARSRQTGERDAWLWYGWGFPGKHGLQGEVPRRSYGKSPKPRFEDKLP